MKYPIRSIICAPKDYYLLSADLSQAETWVVAYLSKDRLMKEALANGRKSDGTDIHSITAKHIFDLSVLPTDQERFVGKKTNHQCSYQGGDFKLAESINKESDKPPFVTISVSEAKQKRIKWLELFGSIQMWWADVEERIRSNRTIITCYQRKRIFYGIMGKELFKEATAHEPQSTIADHMLGAIQPEIGITGGLKGLYSTIITPSNEEIRIINTSHDSAILECPRGILDEIAIQVVNQLKRPMMINGEEFTVPVDIEYGERWGEMEKIKI